jgi:hypothetical protein
LIVSKKEEFKVHLHLPSKLLVMIIPDCTWMPPVAVAKLKFPL